jgi:hypothetical protein
MFSLAAGTLWMWIRYPLFQGFYYSTEFLALTHTLTLGFVTSLIMGVLYRLVPMSLFVQPRSRKWARAQFACHAIGLLGIVYYFLNNQFFGLAWSAFMMLATAVIQVYNWWGLVEVARKGDWVARYVVAAMAFFVLAALVGVLLGFNKGLPGVLPWLKGSFITNLYAHIHLAGAGWVTSIIFGFHLRLWPRTLGHKRWLGYRFVILQTGVLGLTVTFLLNAGSRMTFGALIGIATLWQIWGPFKSWIRGRAREAELVPLVLFFGVVVLGLLLAAGWPGDADPLRARLQLTYGFVGTWGWFVITIAIFAFKLFPMWVWQERFQADFGKTPVPGMRQLYSHKLRTATTVLLSSGVVSAGCAIALGSEPAIRVALTLVLLGVTAFLTNFIRVARWALFDRAFVPTPKDVLDFQRMFPTDEPEVS